MELYIVLLYSGTAIVTDEYILTWIGFILIQPFLFLCSKPPEISAIIIKGAFRKRVHVVRYENGLLKVYSLPRHLNCIATSANVNDPSVRFGEFELFVRADPGGWVGFTTPKVFSSSRGFFSPLVRGEEDLAGRKVVEVEIEQFGDGNGDLVIGRMTGVGPRIVGEVLGVCEVCGWVAVSIEDWFVESDGWKMGIRMEETLPPVDTGK